MNKAQRCGARACSGFVRQACGCGRDCSQAANPWAGCVLILALILPVAGSAAACHGRFPNPLTDVCWRCIFPIHIGPARISMGMEDAGAAPPLICTCPAPPPLFVRFGLGVSFWEPARVAEVVRTPFCAPLLGGVELADLSTVPAGTGHAGPAGGEAYYHVHWYAFPVLAWMNLLTDLACQDQGGFDLLYLTELDPLWQDDELSFLLNPEAALFANPAAQAACAADCLAASAGFPLDNLFWCAGCQGSMYPLVGSTAHNTGGIDTSLLLTQRMASKLHRQLVARDTSTSAALCGPVPQPIMRKGQYKTQLLYPRPRPHDAQPLGRLSQPWGAGGEYPVRGEDWAYLIFRKRTCCAF